MVTAKPHHPRRAPCQRDLRTAFVAVLPSCFPEEGTGVTTIPSDFRSDPDFRVLQFQFHKFTESRWLSPLCRSPIIVESTSPHLPRKSSCKITHFWSRGRREFSFHLADHGSRPLPQSGRLKLSECLKNAPIVYRCVLRRYATSHLGKWKTVLFVAF